MNGRRNAMQYTSSVDSADWFCGGAAVVGVSGAEKQFALLPSPP